MDLDFEEFIAVRLTFVCILELPQLPLQFLVGNGEIVNNTAVFFRTAGAGLVA